MRVGRSLCPFREIHAELDFSHEVGSLEDAAIQEQEVPAVWLQNTTRPRGALM